MMLVVAKYEGTLGDLRAHLLDHALRRFGGVGDAQHLRHAGRLEIVVDDRERATGLADELRRIGMSVEIEALDDDDFDDDFDDDDDLDDEDEEEEEEEI